MILALSSSGKSLEVVDVGDRVGHALGVRVVGTEAHVVDTDQVDEALRVLLVERVDPDVALQHVDRVLLEQLRLQVVGLVEVLDRRPHPVAAVLHREDLDASGSGWADRGR